MHIKNAIHLKLHTKKKNLQKITESINSRNKKIVFDESQIHIHIVFDWYH
jgi:hypothetical protein